MKFIYEQDEGFEPFPLYPVLLDMKGDTLDVDTAASSDMYLGTLKEPPPGSPKTSKPRPRLPGVKVGVDLLRVALLAQQHRVQREGLEALVLLVDELRTRPG